MLGSPVLWAARQYRAAAAAASPVQPLPLLTADSLPKPVCVTHPGADFGEALLGEVGAHDVDDCAALTRLALEQHADVRLGPATVGVADCNRSWWRLQP